MKQKKTDYEIIHSWHNRLGHWVLTRMFGFIYWPLFIKYLDWIKKNEDKIMQLVRQKNPDLGRLYDMDKAIEAKLKSAKASAPETNIKADEALEHWLNIMEILNSELQTGKMTAEEVADILTQTPQHRQAFLKKDERFATYFKENHPEINMDEAQNFIDAELERIIEEQKKSENIKNIGKNNEFVDLLSRNEKEPLKQVMLSIEERLKAQKKAKAMAEQEKYYQEHLKRLAAMNPEMLEGIGKDQFQTTQTQNQRTEKILQREQVVLRKKLSEKDSIEKSMKQIGSEKQKALNELKKNINSNINGSI